MAKNSRVPAAVGAIPVLGSLAKQADTQAQWMQDLVEQNARIVGQFPATMKNFNDSLERFNQTVGRLDRLVSRVESAAAQFVTPMEEVGSGLDRLLTIFDPRTLKEIPEALESMRQEALPALQAATDTQRQLARLTSAVEKVVNIINEIPGAGMVRRLTPGLSEET